MTRQPQDQGVSIEIADLDLEFRTVSITDHSPTGAQLAAAAGFHAPAEVVVLQILADGDLETIRPNEVVDLRHQPGKFVIAKSDRTYVMTIDGQRFEWPARTVSGAKLRRLGNIPPDCDILLERSDTADRPIGERDLVNLGQDGVESFVTRKRTWQLNVQGVLLEALGPTISVTDAMTKAGFDVGQSWLIFLKIAGQPKQPVGLDFVIDLTTPGIEKLRLTPKDVNNGEAPPAPRRAFDLLDADEAFLDQLGLRWETVEDARRRWLLIHNYPVQQGYTVRRTTMALEIPSPYPSAQIDMFYTYPPLALASGRPIPSTQVRATICGVEYHGWSRHRGGASTWDPARDNVATQLALVEAAIAKEIGE